MMPNETPESFKKRKEKNGYNNGTTIPNLQVHVVMEETNWKTPQTVDCGIPRPPRFKGDAPSEKGSARSRMNFGDYRMDLKDQVALPPNWPTPRATKMEGTTSKDYGNCLLETVLEAGQPGPNNPNTTGKNLELNPNWVEQLMGLPIGWTDCDS